MINKFTDKYAFLSNFYKLTWSLHWRGINYPTVEHFFQAMKTYDFNERLIIANCQTPNEAKRLGRKVKLRKDWSDVKDIVMEMGVLLKFTMNVDIANKLISTDNMPLVEGNYWHDNYWGNCMCPKCVDIVGRNHLGITLVIVREKLTSIG